MISTSMLKSVSLPLEMQINIGALYITSSGTSQQFMRKWIVEMVDQNKMNDQRVLSFHFVKNSMHTGSCNLYRETASWSHPYTADLADPKSTNQFKYCFINEIVFQNGKMEFFYPAGTEDQDTNVQKQPVGLFPRPTACELLRR